MLGNQYYGIRAKAKEKFRQKVSALRDSLVVEYAEMKGATKLVAQIDMAKSKIEDLESELSTLGFDYGGHLRFRNGSSNPLTKSIGQRVEKELGTEDALDARFDSAQIAMMTVASLEDADKILKSVSEI